MQHHKTACKLVSKLNEYLYLIHCIFNIIYNVPAMPAWKPASVMSVLACYVEVKQWWWWWWYLQSIFVSIPPMETPNGTGQSLKNSLQNNAAGPRISVPLRGDLTGASLSLCRCWGTDWNFYLQSVEVDNNNMTSTI